MNDTEKAIIGLLIRKPDLLYSALEKKVSSLWFEDPIAGSIFSVIIDRQDKPLDLIILSGILNKKEFDSCSLCIEFYAKEEYFSSYIEQLKESYAKRLLTTVGQSLVSEAASKEANDTISSATTALVEVAEKITATSGLISSKSAAASVYELMEDSRINGGLNNPVGMIPTGLRCIDQFMYGFMRGSYVILAARPGVGKTGLSLTMAVNMAKKGLKVGFISLEISMTQVIQRVIGILSGVTTNAIMTCSYSDDDAVKIAQAFGVFSELNIHFLDSSIASSWVNQKAVLIQEHRKAPFDIIFIDYIQLMTLGGKTSSRYEEITTLSRELRLYSLQHKTTVVALSQLARPADKGKKIGAPTIHELKESGGLESDAEVVIGIDRPGVSDQNIPQTEAHLHILKNRNFQTGTVPVYYKGETMSFWDVAYREL